MTSSETTPEAAVLDDPRWADLTTRNPQADRAFVYCVTTTGIYCRPSCPARLARPENIVFHGSPDEAERAGFRPCKRCKPDQRWPADEQAGIVIDMTSSSYRAGGADTDIRFAVGDCSLGAILVAQSQRGVCAILLGDDAGALVQDLQDQFPAANLVAGEDEFEQMVATVVGFVEAPALGLDLPLDIRGTVFQRRVWEVLRRIPPGTTLSYADVAERMGASGSARAVARACAGNILAVAIPCHRVVRQDGALSGYRWGVARKRALLEREARG